MKKSPKSRKKVNAIAEPATLLKAANEAPTVFSVAAYFTPLYVMRQKGHSWRYIADWLKGFHIEVSHVHLNRLYVKEDARLSRLTRNQLLDMGMPPEMIDERQTTDDPTKRFVAPDPEDQPDEDEDEDRR